MFEIIASFMNRILAADAAYDKAMEEIQTSEKEALARIQAEASKIKADHERNMAAIKANHKARMEAIKASRPNHSPEVEEALRRSRELRAKFETLLAKHHA